MVNFARNNNFNFKYMKNFLLSLATVALLGGAAANAENRAPIEADAANSAYSTQYFGPEDAQWVVANASYVSIDGTFAPTLNGKTSAVGSITSPTLTGGINNLSFKYANTFSETKGVSLRIDIKQNGEVVATETLTKPNADVAKGQIYSFSSESFNIEGDFSIFITNLSPSNNTGNKDRVSIWDLEWTNFGETAKQPNGLSVAESHYRVNLGETFANPVENPNNLDLAWTSSKPNVAEVVGDGIEIKGAGITEITATFSGSADFMEGSVSFSLTVVDPDAVVWEKVISSTMLSTECDYVIVAFPTAGAQIATPLGTQTYFGNMALDDVDAEAETIDMVPEDAQIFNLDADNAVMVGDKYLYISADKKAGLKDSADDAAVMAVGENGEVSITGEYNNSTYNLRYNPSSPRFCFYTQGQTAISVFTRQNQNVTSVATLSADEAGEALFFDFTGRRISEPTKGMFIRVQGGKATKVVK